MNTFRFYSSYWKRNKIQRNVHWKQRKPFFIAYIWKCFYYAFCGKVWWGGLVVYLCSWLLTDDYLVSISFVQTGRNIHSVLYVTNASFFLRKCVMCQVKLKCRILLKTYKNRTKQERAHKCKYDMTWKVLTIKIYDEIGQVTYITRWCTKFFNIFGLFDLMKWKYPVLCRRNESSKMP